eukprot:12424870-Karenia_brevis.AAC.1
MKGRSLRKSGAVTCAPRLQLCRKYPSGSLGSWAPGFLGSWVLWFLGSWVPGFLGFWAPGND